MTREIKFRAWNGISFFYQENQYLGSFIRRAVGHINSNLREDKFGHQHESYLPNGGDVSEYLTQYTGLKDKNGKEIYEGDIVKCSSGCPHIVERVDNIGGTYGGGMPGFTLSGLKRNYGEGYARIGTEELIGNIYENPDLLSNKIEGN